MELVRVRGRHAEDDAGPGEPPAAVLLGGLGADEGELRPRITLETDVLVGVEGLLPTESLPVEAPRAVEVVGDDPRKQFRRGLRAGHPSPLESWTSSLRAEARSSEDA